MKKLHFAFVVVAVLSSNAMAAEPTCKGTIIKLNGENNARFECDYAKGSPGPGSYDCTSDWELILEDNTITKWAVPVNVARGQHAMAQLDRFDNNKKLKGEKSEAKYKCIKGT